LSAPADQGALRERIRWPTLGNLAASSLLLLVVSGIVLALHYDPGVGAYDSVARIEQVVPLGWFVRRFHHWAAQLLLIGAVAHLASIVWRRRDERFKTWRWTKAVMLLPLVVMGCFSGFVLRGSAQGLDAATVMVGLAGSVPGIGEVLARSLYRPEPRAAALLLPYMHHLATITAALMYLSSEHLGRLRRSPAALGWAALLIGVLALGLGVPTGHAPDSAPEVVRGPWFFVGVQLILRWLPPLLAGVLLPLAALGLVWAIPVAGSRARPALIIAAVVAALVYAGLTAWGWLG
jgi:ubiquinol-cytochrome c reductase cytochrome b subunit